MAGLALKLITKSKLFSEARPCFNLHHHHHRRLLSTMNTTNSTPAVTLRRSAPHIPAVTAEDLAVRTAFGHNYWKVMFVPPYPNQPEKQRLSLDLPRDELIAEYVKFLATVLNQSEEEAKKKIHSVSTRYGLFFIIKVPFETAAKILEMNPTCTVVPVFHEDLTTKDHAETGEPFIDGKAVEYDPIYYEGIRKKLCAPVIGREGIRKKLYAPVIGRDRRQRDVKSDDSVTGGKKNSVET